MKNLSIFLIFFVSFILVSCAIDQNISPVRNTDVDLLCIKHNDNILMADFEPTLVRLIEKKGIETKIIFENTPGDCRYSAVYSANWRWDLAMYLYYARIEIFADFQSIGKAEYDATLGGLNLSKFGSTEDKIQLLIEQLFPKHQYKEMQRGQEQRDINQGRASS